MEGVAQEGVAHPPFITQADWDYLRAHRKEMHRPGDVWVVAYPKSGTTLTEQIVLLLQVHLGRTLPQRKDRGSCTILLCGGRRSPAATQPSLSPIRRTPTVSLLCTN
jgi:hypothetical protein